MSDAAFWFVSIATVLVFAVVIIAIYAGLRAIEDRYRHGIERIRRAFATYSVPIVLILIFALDYYHGKKGYICNAAGDNTAGWTCTYGWLLIPLLFVSISLSSWYWVVYRRKIDPLDRASQL